jgi:predicted RNA methylase
MKLRNLQALLEGFEGPPAPKIDLEQYPTPPRLAAEVIFNAANLHGDIAGKRVADLGCGCGILSIAALCMGAAQVLAYDIDPTCLDAARRNLETLSFDEPPNIEFYVQDVLDLKDVHVDTVIMNPPFGTRNKGRDLSFLKIAGEISTGGIYSFHKSATRRHILEVASPKFGLKGDLMQEVDFDLKKLYKFHKSDTKAVQVDVYHFVHLAKRNVTISAE